MNNEERQTLTQIHAEALAAYHNGTRTPDQIASAAARDFLQSLGISTQFLYDCTEDFSSYGQPDRETFLELCAIRAGYFREVMKGAPAPRTVDECELPRKTEEFDGIAWLPRMIRKAQCFLNGCLCPEIMYGCAGDRAFVGKHEVSLTDFLKQVRDTEGDPARMAAFLRSPH